MKQGILLACLCCTLFACENVEKKAGDKLQEARTAFEHGDFNEAKQLIDTLKILYPKAFEARRAGIALMQDIELEEQNRTLTYLDSMLTVKNQKLKECQPKFVLEKDAEYQEIGNYLAPAQVLEKNLHRSYLRFQVDETGKMSMTSVYCGKTPIHHIAVKVIAPDGSFAETPASADSYETKNLGEFIEKADYTLGNDGSVISFICMNKGQNLKVNYRGEGAYTTTMTAADRKAADDVYQLAQLLSTITEIKKNKEEAQLKKEFVQRKKQEREKKAAEAAAKE